MDVSTSQLAAMLGLSQQRVRALAAQGALGARRVGGRWVFESGNVESARRSARPMTATNAWHLIALAEGEQIDNIRAEERYRLRQRLGRLCDDQADAGLLLRSWLALRAERIEYEAADATAVSTDERLTLSGISDDNSGVTRSNEAEAYVRASDLVSVEMGHALFRVGKGEGNVVLHVVSDADRPRASLLLTAADLAERVDPRSRGQVATLVRQWCEGWAR
jgi:hypothetical protein